MCCCHGHRGLPGSPLQKAGNLSKLGCTCIDSILSTFVVLSNQCFDSLCFKQFCSNSWPMAFFVQIHGRWGIFSIQVIDFTSEPTWFSNFVQIGNSRFRLVINFISHDYGLVCLSLFIVSSLFLLQTYRDSPLDSKFLNYILSSW